MSGSLPNIFTAAQNIVTALNGAAQTQLRIAGTSIAPGVSAQSVVSANPGRLCVVTVIAPGSASGTIYDASTTATAVAGRRLWTIPQTAGTYPIGLPVEYGIVVTPGTGQVVAVGYS